MANKTFPYHIKTTQVNYPSLFMSTKDSFSKTWSFKNTSNGVKIKISETSINNLLFLFKFIDIESSLIKLLLIVYSLCHQVGAMSTNNRSLTENGGYGESEGAYQPTNSTKFDPYEPAGEKKFINMFTTSQSTSSGIKAPVVSVQNMIAISIY